MSNASLPIELLRLQQEGRALTANERSILKLLATGESMVSVAARRGKSIETIRKQAKMARAKLGARTNTQAVATAVSLDLI